MVMEKEYDEDPWLFTTDEDLEQSFPIQTAADLDRHVDTSALHPLHIHPDHHQIPEGYPFLY